MPSESNPEEPGAPPTGSAARSVLDLARSVLSELDLDAVLQRVLDAARQLTGARYAAVGVLDDSRSELARFVALGIDEETRAEIGELPRGLGVLGELIRNPAPLRLADVGAHKSSYGFPAGHPPMHTFLGVPIFVREVPFGNLYLTEKAGGAEFTDADEEALVTLAEFAGLAIDHARKYTGAASRRDELERTVATLEATTEVAKAVGRETDLDLVLELVAKRGRALVSARALLIERQLGDELVIVAGAGELPEGVIGAAIPFRDTLADRALQTLKPQRLADELNRARFDQHGLGTLGVRADSGLVVPLIFQGNTYGVLVAIDRLDGPQFTAEDQRLLEAFATSAATAVATAQSVADEQRRQRAAAAESERHRWARELHDETLQGLGGLRVALSMARRSGDRGTLDRSIGEAVEQLDSEIASLRSLIAELRPAALDELGVEAAIRSLAERATTQGLDVEVSIDLAYEARRESTRHTAELESALYRITQEALMNAAKHARAERASVEIREDESTIELSVKDDGVGFDPTAETEGFGLLGLRERVELLAGDLFIDSAPGRGTSIMVSLPVQRRGAENEGVDQTGAPGASGNA
jgi:signal transduction histidine kinase